MQVPCLLPQNRNGFATSLTGSRSGLQEPAAPVVEDVPEFHLEALIQAAAEDEWQEAKLTATVARVPSECVPVCCVPPRRPSVAPWPAGPLHMRVMRRGALPSLCPEQI